MRRLRSSWLPILVHILALLPLVSLTWDFAQGRLTANPIEAIQLRTGRYALNLLLLTLACTPVQNVFGFKPAGLLRRQLGLYAFLYASLHLLNFIGLDYRLDFGLLWDDISGKRFVVAGLTAFLVLLALAVTSTKGWQKRLGERWPQLHRLVYVAALVAAIHFIWQTKADFRAPFAYTAIVALLLAVRIPVIARAIRIRGRRAKPGALTQA